MKTFNLLPNDERIQGLTEEQIDFIWCSLMIDDAKAKGKTEVYIDPDFDEEWNKLEKEDKTYKQVEVKKDEIDDWEEV
jgi:hypothetical protein